jgi:hypothetical protein
MDPNSDDNRAADAAPENPGRRWLLKSGAVAGPLVLTLRGGGGWVGSGTRCNYKNGQKLDNSKLSQACLVSLGLKK